MQIKQVVIAPHDISDAASAPEPTAAAKKEPAAGKSYAAKKKEAILRKKTLSGVGPASPEAPSSPPPPPPKPPLKPGEKSLSWSEKRMHAYLSTRGVRSSHDAVEPEPVAPVPSPRSPRAPGDVSWTQKRKEIHLRKYGYERSEAVSAADVAVSAVKFVARLKGRVNAGTEGAARLDSAAPTRPASRGSEKSWKQLRKEAYLRKYGRERQGETTQADVAVSAVSFAAKLKLKLGKN